MNLLGSPQGRNSKESPYFIGSPKLQRQDSRKGLHHGILSPNRQVVGKSMNFDQQSTITASFGHINVSGESSRNQPQRDSRHLQQGSPREIIIGYAQNSTSQNGSMGHGNPVFRGSPPSKLIMHKIKNSEQIPRILTDSKKVLPPRPPSQPEQKQTSARQRQLQNVIDNLKQQLERKNNMEKNLEQKPQTLSQPLINQFHEQIKFYKGQSQKLMAQNINLKKQLVFTRIQSDEKLLKIGSVPSLANLPEVIFSQSSIRQEIISKQAIVRNLDFIKQLIVKLNKLKESEIEMLKNHQNTYDYLIIDAEYQTNFFNLSTEIENIKYRITFDSDRRDTIPKDDSKITIKDLKSKNMQLSEEVVTLKEYIQKENQWKARFLLQFEKQNAMSRATHLENEELKKRLGDNQQDQELRNLVRHQQIIIQQLRQELANLHSHINNLQQQLSEKDKYMKELENSLSQIKPKRPFILNRSAEERESQSQQKVTQLASQNSRLLKKLSQLKVEMDNLRRPQQRQSVLKQLIQQLNVKINDMEKYHNEQCNLKNNTIRMLEDRILKLESGLDVHDTSQKEQLLKYQKEISGILTLANENEQKIKTQFSREIMELQKRFDSDKNQYISLLRQLTEQKAKNEEDFQTRQRELMGLQVSHEKEISKLNSENAALKKSMEIQIQRLAKTNTEHEKTLIQKYEKDILTLNRVNHQLMTDNKNIVLLQQQNNSLTGHIRQLQTQIKDKSTVVDHLWEIKKVEYDNIMKQIYRLKVTNL